MTESARHDGEGRLLRLHILRYDPQEKASRPRVETFELREADGMTLFVALTEIQETQDPSLNFDFVCRAGICGSCGMMINGRPGLACRTLTKDLDPDISLAPLPVFELISDLSVNTGNWMRDMSERLETWVHAADNEVDVGALEKRMEPALARDIYELERCIECGCCVAACGTAHMREDFVGAVGLNKIARFRLDPRDDRDDAEFYELVGDESGVFGCLTLLGCVDVCPKDLPLAGQIAFLRRHMARQGIRDAKAQRSDGSRDTS
jgi:fumarate reductase iron-sulfur subunit